MRIAVLKERTERRVALVPESVARLTKSGVEVLVERGAGSEAGFPDSQYESAGASLADSPNETMSGAALVLRVQPPLANEVAALPEGVVLISTLPASVAGERVPQLAARNVTLLGLERVPRITRAQSMDILSSQATVAGYKAVLIGAAAMPRLMPMMTTAAGSLAPAKAFIIGAGVAGLQAIATSRRLGAVVSAFDVRAAVKEQVQSLGASFVEGGVTAEGTGGYAREQTGDEQARMQQALADHIKDMDLTISTAAIPGKKAPVLITEAMVRSMKPGSVIVDLAAETGGNCAVTRAGETYTTANGVTILGPVNLPSTVPMHASQMFSRNVLTLLQHLITKEGELVINLEDDITGPMCLAHGGQVRS
ncbi:MAG: NAD(P) transhydrogenase subunit alpha [Acidobacteria bacterium]|nr:NAD(P) transhydrogenase subunit alpha [Acidobacteriota bacterium]